MSEQGTVVHLAYNWMIVVYFFLGGLSAGTYFFSVAVNFWKQEFKHFAKKSALISLIAISIGLLTLLFDLGQPFRAWRLFLSFNPRSPISWGIWFVNIFMFFDLIYNFFLFKGGEAHTKKFAYSGLPFALLTATYTGMLLAQAPDRILWHTALMPVLFLNGAIISGIALVMLLSATDRNVELLSKLGRLVAWLVILELGMILAETMMLLNGGTESAAAIKVLLSGQLGFLFIGIEIVLGAVIPTVLLLRGKKTVFIQVIASILILIGIFTMRYVIVTGGQLIS
jgi:formate-dependent nitrite reductase membrane component NrfD